jgi:hypothetical protein
LEKVKWVVKGYGRREKILLLSKVVSVVSVVVVVVVVAYNGTRKKTGFGSGPGRTYPT